MTETHLFSGDQFYATTDTCYLDSGNPNNNYQGYDWDLISDGSTTTRMGIMMFKIPDRSSAIVQPISDKAYISQIDLKLDISNAGASLYFWPLSSSHTSAIDFALATYSRPGILGDSSNIKWNPASWSHIDPSHTTTVLIGGNMLGQLVVSSTGVKTFSITPEMLKILGADFGSTVYLAVYASSNNNVIVDLKPRPVLQELIEDLTNKMLAQKQVLADCGEYADPIMIQGLKSDIRLLSQVIERCYAQQELINLRDEQIIGLN